MLVPVHDCDCEFMDVDALCSVKVKGRVSCCGRVVSDTDEEETYSLMYCDFAGETH